jgi:methyltransferase (TIGR00027 family)
MTYPENRDNGKMSVRSLQTTKNQKIEKPIHSTLKGVPKTLLITLWARARETASKNPIINDSSAVKILEMVENGKKLSYPPKLKVTLSMRTRSFDQLVKRYLDDHPNAVVVNLGAGLDTRFERVDNGMIDWFDLDLPEVIAIRRELIPETSRRKTIASSVLDPVWMEGLVAFKQRPFLFLAEGLFMYLSGEEVRGLFSKLQASFPHSRVIFETASNRMVKMSQSPYAKIKWRAQLRTGGNVMFKWGIDESKEIEAWHEGLRLVEEDFYMARPEKKLGFMRLFQKSSFFSKSMWIVHYALD